MPRVILKQLLVKMTEFRPQVSFLPLVEDKGRYPPRYQPSLVKTLAIHKGRAAQEQIETLSF